MGGYPTDEELNSFLKELEKEELYAPRHLKEEIMQKAAKMQNAEKEGNRKSQTVSFLSYTLKMVAGMAAAVILVFAIPAADGSNISRASTPEVRQKSLDEKIGAHMEQKREAANLAVDEIMEKFNGLLSFEALGGMDDEN